MTTRVTVDAHAGWPVQVEIIDQYPGQAEPRITTEIVPALEKRDFYVHSSRALTVRELKKDA